jgi:carboxypeptidase family protein
MWRKLTSLVLELPRDQTGLLAVLFGPTHGCRSLKRFSFNQLKPTRANADLEEPMFPRNLRRSLVVFWLGLAFCLAIPSFSQTQVYGTISGTITDKSGAIIPDAKVTIANKDTGQSQTTTTNGAGYYVVTNLPAGKYDVTAEKEGFQRCADTGVTLDPAGSVQLTCVMQVGQVTQTVEVQAQALAVSTEEAKVARVVNDTQIQEMPVNGRNFATLLALQPGVVQAFSFNSFQGMNLFATQDTHVNGLRGDSNNVQIEGSPSTRTRANGAMVAAPSIDAIGEINIVTTGYMPEYSRGAGGQIIIQMKSGTNQYHGGAYEFLRNDSLDARNFFSPTVSTLKFNNFGYDVGGPIIPHKNKLFFFWSQEWSRIRTSSTTVATVPTLQARQGNFSDYCAAGLPCPVVPRYLNGVDGLVFVPPPPPPQPDPRPGICAAATVPTPGCFSSGGQVNVIPSGPTPIISPNGAAFLQAMAAPTISGVLGNNFRQEIGSPSNDRKETIKVDYEMENVKSHLAVALRHYTQDALPSWGTSGSSQLLQISPIFPERGGTVDFTTNISPTLLNDFAFTATEDIVHVNLHLGKGLDRSSLGINYPYIFGDASKDIAGKIPTVNINGFDSISGLPYPSGSVGKVFVFQDIVTKIHGNHVLKGGVWLEQDGENDRDQVRVTPGSAGGIGNNLNGTFTFDGSNASTTTGAPLADAFLGNFGAYSELGFRNYTPWVSTQKGLFGQDSWKVTPRLTIQGGLRWDYFPPYHSRWCNFSTFDAKLYSTAPGVEQTVDPATGLVTGGNPYNGIAVPCSQLPRDAIGHFAVFGQELTSSNYAAINEQLKATGMQPGLSPEIFQKHYNNFQPRLGFAWDPSGKGTTSVRGGAGIFYNHFTLSDVTLMGGNTPFQSAAEVIGGPSNGKADCPGGQVDASRNCLPAQASALPLPIPMTGGDLVSKVPAVYQWNFTVQHMLPEDTLVEVGYVGTRGRHLVLNSDLNQLHQGAKFANPGVAVAALVPFQGLGGLTVGLNDANSKYDALQVSVQRRLSKGLQFGVAYTYSNSFDYGSDLYANARNTYDIHYNFGPADWGRRNNLVLNYVYQLPFFKGQNDLAGRLLGGWELSGVAALASGTPTSVTNATGDVAGVQSDFGQYGNRLAGCNPNNAPRSVAMWFNTACFANAAQGTFGNAGRNSVWGPGVRNWDFALYKNGVITEKLRYQFRAEFFNFLNHPSFNSIDTGLGDSAFGQINGANDPREIQFGLKFLF